jgi:hypothetical protein
MNFQDLIYHLEENGCTIDHVYEDMHEARNCINGESCQIENCGTYSSVTLCHYFYELGVSATVDLKEALDKYRSFRGHVDKLIVGAEEESE